MRGKCAKCVMLASKIFHLFTQIFSHGQIMYSKTQVSRRTVGNILLKQLCYARTLFEGFILFYENRKMIQSYFCPNA